MNQAPRWVAAGLVDRHFGVSGLKRSEYEFIRAILEKAIDDERERCAAFARVILAEEAKARNASADEEDERCGYEAAYEILEGILGDT